MVMTSNEKTCIKSDSTLGYYQIKLKGTCRNPGKSVFDILPGVNTPVEGGNELISLLEESEKEFEEE